jgi:anti-anti-sigma regulatory factor
MASLPAASARANRVSRREAPRTPRLDVDFQVAQHKPRVLALDMSRVPDIEYSALQILMESDKRTTERGALVWPVELNPACST